MLSYGLAHFSALGVSGVMRSINVRYLLTYLLTRIYSKFTQGQVRMEVLLCGMTRDALCEFTDRNTLWLNVKYRGFVSDLMTISSV